MKFNLDYLAFFNIHDCSKAEFETVRSDFTVNLTDLLRDMGTDPYFTDSIAYSLFYSMVSDKVFYHTPVHILYMLSFAQENDIALENWETLAVFFHDAIYRPGGNNEYNSSIFMKSLLADVKLSVQSCARAESVIMSTMSHFSDNIKPEHWLVMDLDMAGFAANPKPFNLQNRLIEKEFCQPKKENYGYPLDKFLQGRLAFLTALKNKKSLYRTELFKNTLGMEAKAQINLSNQIIETQRRIDLL